MGTQKAALNLPFDESTLQVHSRLTGGEKEELITKYGGLVKYMAHRLAARLPEHVTVDDLISAGMIGFIDALDKFDPSKQVRFKTYMEIRVKGAMLDELRAMDPVSRTTRQKAQVLAEAFSELEKSLNRPPTDEEMAEKMGITLEEFHDMLSSTKTINILPLEYADFEYCEKEASCEPAFVAVTNSSDPFELLQKKELVNELAKAIAKLPEKEKLVVSLYYYEQLTMKEIGKVLDVSESRVSQIHSKAMLSLRNALEKLTG